MEDNIIRKKIMQILEKNDVSQRKVAVTFGMNQNKFNRQMNGVYPISLDVVLAVLAYFPDVDANWLLKDTEDAKGVIEEKKPADIDELIAQNKMLLEQNKVLMDKICGVNTERD